MEDGRKTVRMSDSGGYDVDSSVENDLVFKDERKTQRINVNNRFNVDNNGGLPKEKPKVLHINVYLTHISWFGLKNTRFQLAEGTTVIGREDAEDPSDISIKGDDSMSRRSVAIIIQERGGVFEYKLKVMNATNRVKVNNQILDEGSQIALEFGDIITLGNTKFRFDSQ